MRTVLVTRSPDRPRSPRRSGRRVAWRTRIDAAQHSRFNCARTESHILDASANSPRGDPLKPMTTPQQLLHGSPATAELSVRALATPEPFVRLFSRRVQQEGALDLTQGDYKNADFAPHPEVVRAAQRITRNTVHSYGPAVGRMDVRSEVAEFFNRDGLLDYPDSEVRFQPDEVLFTPGTRAGLAIVLEVLGADGSGVVVPRPSWEYDWFIERAGKKVVELPTTAPGFLPDPHGARPAARPRRHLVGDHQQSAQPHRTRVSARSRRGTRPRRGQAPLLSCCTTRSTSGSTTSAGSSTRPSRIPSGATGWSRCPGCRRWTCSAPRPAPAPAGW